MFGVVPERKNAEQALKERAIQRISAHSPHPLHWRLT